MNPILDRISINPNVCFGQLCIKGTHIRVSLILDFLANRMSVAEVLETYPHLKREDIRACLSYAKVA